MTDLLLLKGPPALSRFRLDKLRAQLGLNDGPLFAEFVHLLNITRRDMHFLVVT